MLAVIVAVQCQDRPYTDGHNGRPNCETDYEQSRPWRNNFDPTRFWVCDQKNSPAIEAPCRSTFMFLDTVEFLGCVENAKWHWVAPYDPPSLSWVIG